MESSNEQAVASGSSRLAIGLVAFACWTAFGLVESTNGYIGNVLRGTPRPWTIVLINNMPWWYTWLLLTPVILWISNAAPFDGRRWMRSLGIHAVTGLLISVAHIAIEGLVFFALKPAGAPGPTTAWAQIVGFFYAYLMTDLLTYWAVVGVYSAYRYRQRLRESALRASRLEAERTQLALGLAEARMHALRMELNPHFLFNTLNAISGLVRKQESTAAIEMLARLGTLLRTTLDQELAPVIPVSEEIALLKQYIDIERVRFGDRLDVSISVDEGAESALVPTLLLQPLVENAVKYGVSARTGDARIEITVWRDDATLHIEVQDTGTGLANTGSKTMQEGIGLSNSRARLRALFGDRATLRLRNAEGCGACAELSMPFQVAFDSMNVPGMPEVAGIS